MEVEYKKDLRHNYMVITLEDHQDIEPYCLKILEHQSILGALPVSMRRMDNKLLFYYEITAKQSLITVLDKAVLRVEQLRKLCIGIFQVLDAAYNLLLSEDSFMLSPEYIYMDIATNTPYLCYLPGYETSLEQQMNSLMEYLMNRVDYNDKEAVLLVYRLYALCRESGFVYDQLMDVLEAQANNKSNQKGTLNEGSFSVDEDKLDSVNTAINNVSKDGDDFTSGYYNKSEFQKLNQGINPNIIHNNIKSRDSDNEPNIPIMMERIEGEAEQLYYPFKTYLYCISCILAGVIVIIAILASKVLFNSYSNQIDYSKLFALILIFIGIEGYLLNKFLDTKNKITRMVKTYNYIDPRQIEERPILNRKQTKQKDDKLNDVNLLDSSVHELQESNPLNKSKQEEQEPFQSDKSLNSDSYDEEDINPTCLLNNSLEQKKSLILKATNDLSYTNINITYFPFFIGKLKRNVDYCLENNLISRFHAKITKEGELYYLTDLNSTNGTFINNEALQTYEKRELKVGDEVRFANITYTLLQQ